MVRPSNPKLMARVLDAVTHLGDGKGSLTRDVLNFVKDNTPGPARTLTMQVQRALKHAVNAGLLRCKNGRYKAQFALNPVTHHQHHREDTDKNTEASNDTSDEPPVGGTDPTRKVQERRKRSDKKKRSSGRRGSSRRSAKKRGAKRQSAAMDKRVRKLTKRPIKRKSHNDDKLEEWSTAQRRIMAKSKYDNYEDDDDVEEEKEDMRTRKSPKINSVNEDRYSDISGDSLTVGRHRSRRSKYLANEKSPSRREHGDTGSNRKSSRRSTSRRRSNQRERESRQELAHKEIEAQPREMDDETYNVGMELDDDQGDVHVDCNTPPDDHKNE